MNYYLKKYMLIKDEISKRNSNVSMSQLSEALLMSRSTFYRNFDSKTVVAAIIWFGTLLDTVNSLQENRNDNYRKIMMRNFYLYSYMNRNCSPKVQDTFYDFFKKDKVYLGKILAFLSDESKIKFDSDRPNLEVLMRALLTILCSW